MRFEIRRGLPRGAVFAAVLAGAVTPVMCANAAITISRGVTKNTVCANGVCMPTARNAVLNVFGLESLLASGSVKITTTGAHVQAADIIVGAPIGWTTGDTLDLDARHSISIDNRVSIGGLGGLSLETNDGGSGGKLAFGDKGHVALANLSSNLAIGGVIYTLVNSVAALASAIALDPSGDYALADNYNAQVDGTYASSPIPTVFNGVFAGLGNVISNLSIKDKTRRTNVGLFGEIGAGGTVEYLGLTKLDLKAQGATQNIGGVAGMNGGLLLGDNVAGKITAGRHSYVGALTGNNGKQGGIISDCHAAASVGGGNASQVGGLVGVNGGAIDASYSTGTVFVSGIATVEGGLVGDNIGLGSIRESFATGSVTGGQFAGGLVGSDDGHIYDSYATGNVSGIVAPKGQYGAAGGIAGIASDAISVSYSTGTVASGANGKVGGFVGVDISQNGIAGSYWDTDTSGIANLSQGAGNIANDPGITGLTTAQFQAGLPAGFDSAIWNEKPEINGGLPYLLANAPP